MKHLDGVEMPEGLEDKGKLVGNTNTIESYDKKIESLYNLKKYKSCLDEILNSTQKITDDNNYIRGLCCLLFQIDIEGNLINDLKSKIKREGYTNLIYAYNYLTKGNKYTGDIDILNRFALILIDSSDGDCIKYIRMILENNKEIEYVKIAKKAYEKGMYYLSEEIINLYCIENRYDYEILIILINVCLNTGKLKECQKYISFGRVINDSVELGKLDCICKIKECKNILLNFKQLDEPDSLQRVCYYLDESEKILSK